MAVRSERGQKLDREAGETKSLKKERDIRNR
jgi:hypothetical protein